MLNNITSFKKEGSHPFTKALKPSIFDNPSMSLLVALKTTPVLDLAYIAFPRLSPIKVPSTIFPNPSATLTSYSTNLSIGHELVLRISKKAEA